MKKILYFTFLLVIEMGFAQEDGLNTYNAAFADRLVQVALQNNPNSKIARRNVQVEEYDVKIASSEWLNTIRLSGNINEFNLDSERDVYDRSAFFPRYNLGAQITLGMFLTIPYTTRRNKEEVLIAESMEDAQQLTLEAQVRRQYHNYIMQKKIFKLQEELLMDTENGLRLSEDRFSKGEVSYEDYSVAKGEYNSNQITYYRAEAALRDARVNLEELIGMKLEEVY